MRAPSAPHLLFGGLLALAAALPLPAGAQGRPGPSGAAFGSFSMPSDIVARELAFARHARDKGQWDAFRAFAADDAQMFDGAAPVRVQEWTRRQKEPATPLQWQVRNVWMSCDGTIAATYGTWHAGAAHGWYATVWKRRKKGDYRFILDQGDAETAPAAHGIAAQDDDDLPAIDARVADCPARKRGTQPAPAKDEPKGPVDHLSGEAADHSLAWATTLRPDGGRDYVLRVKLDGREQEVLRKNSAPAKK